MIFFPFSTTALVTFQKWTLVFRLQKEISVPAYQTWMDTGTSNDNPVQNNFPPACLRMFDYGSCDRHFRSHILDNWNGIDKVIMMRILLIIDKVIMMRILLIKRKEFESNVIFHHLYIQHVGNKFFVFSVILRVYLE